MAWIAGCSDGSEPVESVLLVTLDTTRADVLFDERDSSILAPRIAALAERGVRFPQAYTVTPLTLPAHASLMTGLVPPRHGLRYNGRQALPGAAQTLAEVLSEHGLECAAFVSALVLDRGFGLDQGFALYDQPELRTRSRGAESIERPGRETVAAALEWLAEQDEPFFAWVHLYDAHHPYAPAPEPLRRAKGDFYRGEVAVLDDAVGQLLDGLAEVGLDSRTLVVLTADHGESLGEHGEPAHGSLCYEATVRVPLVLAFPGRPPMPGPVRLASLVDLFPTILARLNVPVPPGLDGIDLFDQQASPERGVYFEAYSGYMNYGWSPLAGWLDSRGKYLASSDPEFYLPLQDPLERRDMVDLRTVECEQARADMKELLERPALEVGAQAVDPELTDAVAALGYARGAFVLDEELPSPLEPSDRPSPASRIHELVSLLRADTLYEAGRYAECEPLVAEIVRESPRHVLALDLYALCLMHAREFTKAKDVLRQRLSLSEVADARLNLGLCHLELGQLDQALVEIEAAERLYPGQPAITEALERVHRRLGH